MYIYMCVCVCVSVLRLFSMVTYCLYCIDLQ